MLEREDRIVTRWIGGQHIRGIARSMKMPARAVRDVIERWSSEIVPIDRGVILARQFARLDRLLAVVLPLAASGNLKAVSAACKLITAQNLMVGLCQPNTAQANNSTTFVQINQHERPQTSTDRIEAALQALIARRPQQPRGDVVEDAQVVESEPADAEPAT
jgi:hypothetical protein